MKTERQQDIDWLHGQICAFHIPRGGSGCSVVRRIETMLSRERQAVLKAGAPVWHHGAPGILVSPEADR